VKGKKEVTARLQCQAPVAFQLNKNERNLYASSIAWQPTGHQCHRFVSVIICYGELDRIYSKFGPLGLGHISREGGK
jgi:hypothetical protein